MSLFVGIDIGTSTLKVLVVNQNGETKALAQLGYRVNFIKTGYAEQVPKDWINTLEEALNIIKNKCDLSKVVAIGFSGQMHGMVAVDEKGIPIRDAIIWMDQRTAVESKEIEDILGKELIKNELLNKPAAGMLLCSLYWLKKHELASYEKIYKVLSPKDYLRFYFTGEFFSEESDASSSLAFSVKNRLWNFEGFEKLSIDREIFPKVKKSHESAGKIKKEIAQKFGFSSDVYISLGGGDSAMQLVGNGIIDEAKLALNIGTASQIVSVVNKPAFDDEMRLQTWCHCVDNKWYVQGGALSGGAALKWFKNNVLLDNNFTYEDMDKLAKESKVGAGGLVFLPYLSGSRTPYINPYARGSFFGLTMQHTHKDMIRSVMEGVVLNLKQSYDILTNMGIKGNFLIASGGGANGEVWRQIQADIFNLPVYTTCSEEEACLGAAIIAAVGQGYFSTIEEACNQMVSLNQNYTMPIEENHIKYEKIQKVFTDLYKNNEKLFEKLEVY